MKDKHKEMTIKTAIAEYKNAVYSKSEREISRTINMMEQVWIMCAPFNINGFSELDRTIKEAREKFKNIL